MVRHPDHLDVSMDHVGAVSRNVLAVMDCGSDYWVVTSHRDLLRSAEILDGVDASRDASEIRLVLLVIHLSADVSRASQPHFNGCFNLLELSERGLES